MKKATYSLETNASIRSIIKWVGGKRQIEDIIYDLAPKNFEQYWEACAGGLAIFFKLVREGKIDAAVLSDFNPQLAITYSTVAENVDAVIEALESDQFVNTSENYYLVRSMDRETSWKSFMMDKANYPVIAARVIFLTKLSFNGLWRENKSGQHNAPYCKVENKAIFSEENIRAVSQALQGITIGQASYEYLSLDNWQILAMNEMPVCPTDFFYFDPPYVETFVGYTGDGFGWEDLENIKEITDRLSDLGAFVMISMKDSPEIREMFAGYRFVQLKTHCRINRDASKRKNGMSEIIIMNYDENENILGTDR